MASMDFTSATVMRNPQRKMSNNDTMRININLQGIMFLTSQFLSGTIVGVYIDYVHVTII